MLASSLQLITAEVIRVRISASFRAMGSGVSLNQGIIQTKMEQNFHILQYRIIFLFSHIETTIIILLLF